MLVFSTLFLSITQKLVQVLGGPVTEADPSEKYVYVLTSTSFQKWILAHGDPDKMFYSCQLEPIAKQAFATNVWVSSLQSIRTSLF